VPHDPVRTRALYEQALKGGYVPAATTLAICMIKGSGGPRDVRAGLALVRAAAASGCPAAIERLPTLTQAAADPDRFFPPGAR